MEVGTRSIQTSKMGWGTGTLDLLAEGKGTYPGEEAALYQPAQAPGMPKGIIPPPPRPDGPGGKVRPRPAGRREPASLGPTQPGGTGLSPKAVPWGWARPPGAPPGVAVEAGPD